MSGMRDMSNRAWEAINSKANSLKVSTGFPPISTASMWKNAPRF
jgi:hypothetical protein